MVEVHMVEKPEPQRRRVDHRREATRQAIIEAAESLFAEYGIDAISLRQVGAAVGAKNTAVVSYHFGDKSALIEAILLHRLPAFDRRRAQLVADLEGEPDVAGILRALCLPLFEQRNDRGKRSYAAFLESLGRSQFRRVWSQVECAIPVTAELGGKLRALMPATAQHFVAERLLACTGLLTAAIGGIDRRTDLDAGAELSLFDDAISMAAAAFGAPAAQTG
jgi:AcrR family transcriptional regulator